jgi:hypothetical protein
MNDNAANYGPYHRLGSPGGPGCAVESLKVISKAPDGSPCPAFLLNADKAATEIELLRTVAQGLGVRWGHEDLGWWAVVPTGEESTAWPTGFPSRITGLGCPPILGGDSKSGHYQDPTINGFCLHIFVRT